MVLSFVVAEAEKTTKKGRLTASVTVTLCMMYTPITTSLCLLFGQNNSVLFW